MMFLCHYSQTRMIAYIHGELPPKARRRITAHLDRCPTCSAYYLREREAVRELAQRVSLLGQPTTSDLRGIWRAIDAGMSPKAHAVGQRLVPARYGLAMLMLALSLLLPATLGNRNVPFTLPTQPAPAATTMPKGTTSAATVAMNVTGSSTQSPSIGLSNTPEPDRK